MVVGKAQGYKHGAPLGLRPGGRPCPPPPIPPQAPSPEPRSGFPKIAQGRLAGQAGANPPCETAPEQFSSLSPSDGERAGVRGNGKLRPAEIAFTTGPGSNKRRLDEAK